MCEYMINFIPKLKHLSEKYMMIDEQHPREFYYTSGIRLKTFTPLPSTVINPLWPLYCRFKALKLSTLKKLSSKSVVNFVVVCVHILKTYFVYLSLTSIFFPSTSFEEKYKKRYLRLKPLRQLYSTY